jgi:hypothetical protein
MEKLGNLVALSLNSHLFVGATILEAVEINFTSITKKMANEMDDLPAGFDLVATVPIKEE